MGEQHLRPVLDPPLTVFVNCTTHLQTGTNKRKGK